VVFPTETVYGLGADAFNPEAVAKIYSTKGRPGDNPLILHIAKIDDFTKLAHNPPNYAYDLAKEFWPGPFTLVVKKNPSLPPWLGGHPDGRAETIGIRMPAHPIAQALIQESDSIIAAPSANKAGKPSPTTLAHVLEDYSPQELAQIITLDGGNSIVGLESTVVDATGESPIILRPGAIALNHEKEFTPPSQTNNLAGGVIPRSPGTKYKHYAPRASMTLLSGESEKIAAYILQKCANSQNIGVLLHEKTLKHIPLSSLHPTTKVLSLGGDHKSIAQNLFSRLRQFDQLEVVSIYAEALSEIGLGIAIMDRMRKASEGRIVTLI